MDLIERFTQLFHKPSSEPLPEPDAQLALAALLVRVAKSDHTYRVEEISRIDLLLAEVFSLNPVEAAKMRATSEKLEAAAPDTDRFAQLIHDNVPEPERIKTLQAMHDVMLADGVEKPEEQSVIDAACNALGLDKKLLKGLTKKANK
ncbi:TerB family tellurite resistance protein [Lentibacter algarum]|uniref:tellurite resistance TerB family protein n=1 Tax=Lentibacter algarum TaxID=576131 RepID=UPI001C091C4A|nr:TerB family tellurite resistance protein [Lentibacter algarum]MBU2982757.1 TerB family tellurite resistance protein [Lentibacter algarum]